MTTFEYNEKLMTYRLEVANMIGRILGANDSNSDATVKARIEKIIADFDAKQKA